MKIGIFTGVTSVRSKNIFTAISRYPTGKHEIKPWKTLWGKKEFWLPGFYSTPTQSFSLTHSDIKFVFCATMILSSANVNHLLHRYSF